MGQQQEFLPPVPKVPEMDDRAPQICESMIFDCDLDQAAIGLVDPAHGPFVHRSWFWRTDENMQEKAKSFVPSHLGFTMQRHIPTSNTLAFKLFKGTPEVEISFQLPGVHIEHVRIGKNHLCGMIVVTPISEFQTEVTYQGYWTIPGLNPFRSILKMFTHYFFLQDKRALGKMAYGGLKKVPRRFVGDPDTQAKWYLQLKSEFHRSREENRPFKNPVTAQVLRWRT
jgi:phenylpropionate dioxygenase-like ring-hydroxylating dioxygenase large terminal subunit